MGNRFPIVTGDVVSVGIALPLGHFNSAWTAAEVGEEGAAKAVSDSRASDFL